MQYLENWIEITLTNGGLPAEAAPGLRLVIMLVVLALVAGILFLITKKVIIRYVYKWVRNSKAKWDDALADHKVLNHVAHVVPAIVVKITAEVLFRDLQHIKDL